MIDPIEKLIVSRHLPDPTQNLDRRIEQLMFEPSTTRKGTRKQSAGVLSLVGGSLAACVIGLVFIPSEKARRILPDANRRYRP